MWFLYLKSNLKGFAQNFLVFDDHHCSIHFEIVMYAFFVNIQSFFALAELEIVLSIEYFAHTVILLF